MTKDHELQLLAKIECLETMFKEFMFMDGLVPGWQEEIYSRCMTCGQALWSQSPDSKEEKI
jgi:hypothetical protein